METFKVGQKVRITDKQSDAITVGKEYAITLVRVAGTNLPVKVTDDEGDDLYLYRSQFEPVPEDKPRLVAGDFVRWVAPSGAYFKTGRIYEVSEVEGPDYAGALPVMLISETGAREWVYKNQYQVIQRASKPVEVVEEKVIEFRLYQSGESGVTNSLAKFTNFSAAMSAVSTQPRGKYVIGKYTVVKTSTSETVATVDVA